MCEYMSINPLSGETYNEFVERQMHLEKRRKHVAELTTAEQMAIIARADDLRFDGKLPLVRERKGK